MPVSLTKQSKKWWIDYTQSLEKRIEGVERQLKIEQNAHFITKWNQSVPGAYTSILEKRIEEMAREIKRIKLEKVMLRAQVDQICS